MQLSTLEGQQDLGGPDGSTSFQSSGLSTPQQENYKTVAASHEMDLGE